uniref:Uncharacterized protein n=1 Tax=Kwoniella bestiolae CBS 10118 TaxID=1296100 RepID=A0A1B9G451_9TREE|nr:hypothetical protein I302_03466 [Kwoniella bestiolae CBS 10118]OCF25793.1 hypothetical protein I302_03466 [Kwoniella bestiolae CBS 10118]
MSSEQSSEESPDDLVLSAGDLDMSTQVLPEKLYSMSTPEVTRYMERYVTAKCDARESDLLNEYRKDREERDKLEVEFSRAGSATGRAVRNHITLQTILRSRGASTKTAQLATQTQTRSVLSRLVRERDDLEARLNDCKGRLLTYQQKARSLGSILVEEKRPSDSADRTPRGAGSTPHKAT